MGDQIEGLGIEREGELLPALLGVCKVLTLRVTSYSSTKVSRETRTLRSAADAADSWLGGSPH